ncbi:hypothetical protein HN51_035343 [Arachis hypogaea]|uniref:receptor-like protein kinase HSL1 n=1 Tax=Arachis ipaensis TaxID=130454 RepID=UPI000A2B5B9D|nr:receptor-like protein kinase HSL1 [Arachis ipaensis]XP_025643555.1 receptor-like protein kinase HSL1 [Arachis hypogaea]QHO00374.1 Receptor-like protein kinase [Arachis hypogaea]
MAKLIQLGTLDLSYNEMSGEILGWISGLNRLNELNLAHNRFSSTIPKELGRLSELTVLDLSSNQFSGEIPLELENLKLNKFNLSYNRLSWDVLPHYATKNYEICFVGNPELCVKGFGKCHSSRGRKYRRYAWIFRSIFAVARILFILGVAVFYVRYRNLRKKKRSLNVSKWRSFHKLGFDEFEIVKLMSEDNVIGSRSSGKVYKVVLSSGAVVAVKKLWRETKDGIGIVGSEKDEFDVEVETLGKIRHKNIVRLWSCYNSGDSRLLVYEYIPNGNLADMLKSNKKSLLDWPTRYKIAIDAAEGLSYLHHRDVKSNNILLDSEFGAKVADFGVAKIVNGTSQGAVSMSVIAGSYGYIAPEYAYTLRVNKKSDIYSFGVVILELVTERPSNHADYGENDMVKWVSSLLEQKGMDHVIDPALDSTYREEISKVLSVRFLCTNVLPINCPAMWWVVKMPREAATVPRSRRMREVTHSPYFDRDFLS